MSIAPRERILSCLILLLVAYPGCLGLGAPEESETAALEIAPFRTHASATYELTGGGQAATLKVSLEDAQLLDPGFHPLAGRIATFSLSPATGETLVAAAGFPYMNDVLGFDACMTPLWKWAQPWQEVDAHTVFVGHFLYPFFLMLAGRTLDAAPMGHDAFGDENVTLRVGGHSVFVGTQEGKLQIGQRLQYEGGNPFPTSILAAYGPLVHARLVSWSNEGDPVPACDWATRFASDDPRIQVTPRATREDPPVPASLQSAIVAAERNSLVGPLASFLASHADAYIATWEYQGPEYFPEASESRWTLTYVAPDVRERVAVECRFLAEADIPFCTETGFSAEGTAPRPDFEAWTMASYDAWPGRLQSLLGQAASRFNYSIGGAEPARLHASYQSFERTSDVHLNFSNLGIDPQNGALTFLSGRDVQGLVR